jgi:hypothetical protein
MTRQASFKRLVRARMEKTGESYTAARAALLAANGSQDNQNATPSATPVLPMSDEAIRRRTGRGWEEWFDLLDAWGATERTHAEIARWVAKEHGTSGWDAQSVTVSYERASGRRAVGEHANGFSITVSKTVAVPVQRLSRAVLDGTQRKRWLPDGELRERTSTPSKSARFDWGDGDTRVNIGFIQKDASRSTIAIEHERLADAEEAARMKTYWRDRVAVLKEMLEP